MSPHNQDDNILESILGRPGKLPCRVYSLGISWALSGFRKGPGNADGGS